MQHAADERTTRLTSGKSKDASEHHNLEKAKNMGSLNSYSQSNDKPEQLLADDSSIGPMFTSKFGGLGQPLDSGLDGIGSGFNIGGVDGGISLGDAYK